MKIMRMIVATLSGLLALAAEAEEKLFEPPVHTGYRVDVCRIWGSDCGQPAADEFCRLQGFERADMSMIDHDIGTTTPTITLGDGKLCDQSFCDGFGAINCVRADAGAQSSTTPAPQPRRPGRLKIPGGSEQLQPSPPEPQPAGPPWTPKDVMDSRIDVQGQRALFRLLKGNPALRIDASNILSAVKAGALKGIHQEDQQVPATRAVELGKWWGQILPKTGDGTCMTEPAGKAPIIVMRRGTPPDQARYDAALISAWHGCGIAPTWPVRAYDPSATPGDPPGTGGPFECHGPDDETRLRAQCEHLRKYNMIACDIADAHGAVKLYGHELYGYEECVERVGELLDSCQRAVTTMCGK